MKNWLIGKDPDAGQDWKKEKGMIEDKMVGWHHWLYGHEFEHVLGAGDGQGSLRAKVHGVTESDTIERLNRTEHRLCYLAPPNSLTVTASCCFHTCQQYRKVVTIISISPVRALRFTIVQRIFLYVPNLDLSQMAFRMCPREQLQESSFDFAVINQ